jgi:hypothetical protein
MPKAVQPLQMLCNTGRARGTMPVCKGIQQDAEGVQMKNRKCPLHKNCWDDGGCENCELGNHITKLHKRIDRLKKQNEALTIKCKAIEAAAKIFAELEKKELLQEIAENSTGATKCIAEDLLAHIGESND